MARVRVEGLSAGQHPPMLFETAWRLLRSGVAHRIAGIGFVAAGVVLAYDVGHASAFWGVLAGQLREEDVLWRTSWWFGADASRRVARSVGVLGRNRYERVGASFPPQLATLFHEARRFRSASVRSTSLA